MSEDLFVDADDYRSSAHADNVPSSCWRVGSRALLSLSGRYSESGEDLAGSSDKGF